MLSGLYGAATAMNATQTKHEVIAHNLANAHVPGFRRSVVVNTTFESALGAAGSDQPLGVAEPIVATDFTTGALQQTGRTLDFAIDGDGFFVVDSPNGPLYTRSGAFHVNADGELVNANGFPVQVDGGPLALPPEYPLSQLAVSRDGQLSMGGDVLGRLEVVRFEDPNKLAMIGAGLYGPGDATPQPAEAGIINGMRELSNVSAVEELVDMILGVRQFEAAQRVLKTINDSIQQNTSPQLG